MSALPAFITQGTKVKLKTARSRVSKAAERFTRDTGTREMRQHHQIVLEARQRSLRGEPTVVGARVEAQLPHDRYRVFPLPCHRLSLPPTLDQAGWEIPASSAARLVGVAGPRMKLARRFAAEGAMRTNVVIVSTPSLAFSPSFVEAQEPVGVQAL
jgi:hypothetical protein